MHNKLVKMRQENKRDEKQNASALLALLRAEVLGHFLHVPEEQREVSTVIPYLSFIRITSPTEMNRGMLKPSMCMVVQGGKRVLVGKEVTQYGIGSYVLSAIDIPISGQVTEASQTVPYLGIKIDLDPKEIAALIIELNVPLPEKPKSRVGAYVEQADSEMLETFARLLRLLNKPKGLVPLSHLFKQEILYRLLAAPNGDVLYKNVVSHYHEKGINEAINWIRKNYAEPMKIEKLAKTVSMSVSTLHHRFKAVTVMSPLQYQKQVRLLEARKLLVAGNIEAATAAFQVGYESPSQFSREYKRFFGASPLQDVEYLKHHEFENSDAP